MRVRAVLLVAVMALMVPAAAQAIYGPQAVHHLRRWVEQDCHSYPGFRCLDWNVEHCWKLGRHKVRCKAWQEYRHNGNFRICRFHVSAIERPDRDLVYLHVGWVRCYSESGKEIR